MVNHFPPALHCDAEGCTQLQCRIAGPTRLRVIRGRETVLLEQDITSAPGLNQELEVRLQAAPVPAKR